MKEGIHFVEKRRYCRFNVHYLTDVYFHDEILYATVIDISEGGIGIIFPQKLNIGEKINLKIKHKLDDNNVREDIQFTAQVMWIEKSNIKEMYAGGLEIVEISAENLELLRKQIRVLYERDEKEISLVKKASVI